MVQSLLPVKKGFFVVRFFRFFAAARGAFSHAEVTLRCNECKQRNYNTMKNKKNTPDKLELNKYCPFCKKHTLHTETK